MCVPLPLPLPFDVVRVPLPFDEGTAAGSGGRSSGNSNVILHLLYPLQLLASPTPAGAPLATCGSPPSTSNDNYTIIFADSPDGNTAAWHVPCQASHVIHTLALCSRNQVARQGARPTLPDGHRQPSACGYELGKHCRRRRPAVLSRNYAEAPRQQTYIHPADLPAESEKSNVTKISSSAILTRSLHYPP
jgi:hypothetical protein